jgi:hypothetical protein
MPISGGKFQNNHTFEDRYGWTKPIGINVVIYYLLVGKQSYTAIKE